MKIPISMVVFDDLEQRLAQSLPVARWVVHALYLKVCEEQFAQSLGTQSATSVLDCVAAMLHHEAALDSLVGQTGDRSGIC